MRIRQTEYSNIVSVLANLLLLYVIYMITRVVYVWENWNLFAPTWSDLSIGELLAGSLRFDSSAIFYTNAIYVTLMLLPLHLKEKEWWQMMCKTIFIVVNSIGMATNLADAVYSKFSGRRTTWSFFSEFSNEDNLSSIFFTEVLNHWYLVLFGAVLIAAMIFLYIMPEQSERPQKKGVYYLVQMISLAATIAVGICAMRGGFTTAVRPITISNANQYVNNPTEAAIVLNTPFSMIRTIGKTPFEVPDYMSDEEMNNLYSPLWDGKSGEMKKKNVVVLIVESFGREYFGYYNDYKGYTPFTDSLLEHSLTYEYTFANGRKSIDGMPSILSSIPMFVEPFFLTEASLNDVGGMAGCLSSRGYATAFFHGAENGSMGFQAFARTTGFGNYYGRTEYDADKRFGGEKDFDGTWAIWDEPFLQYYAMTMSNMKEPFMTAVFTASSHHPFVIPEQYKDIFPEGKLPMYKCIRYTDNALRKFFDTAKKQLWYKNTIFVITADHTNMTDRDEYRTSLGLLSVPIIFFDPSGEMPTGRLKGVAQQIDIMPTLLNYLGYSSDYIAFGKDLLSDDTLNWAVNYSNGIYQYVDGDYLILFDGTKITAFYNYRNDPLQKDNLLGTMPEKEKAMLLRLKAIIQSYMIRMTNNSLVYLDE